MPSLPQGFSRLLHSQALATSSPQPVAFSLGHLPASWVFLRGTCFPWSPVRGQTRRKELLGKSWPGGACAGRMVGRGPSGEGAEQPSVDEAQLLPQGQEGRTLLRVAAPALQHDAVDLGRAGAGPGKAVAPGDLPYGFLVCHSCKEGEDVPESDVPKTYTCSGPRCQLALL